MTARTGRLHLYKYTQKCISMQGGLFPNFNKSCDAATSGDRLMEGLAGQSFGAFVGTGITLTLESVANDFVGKGLCGGELILCAQGWRRGRVRDIRFLAI